MTELVNFTIDGKAVSVPRGTTILEAARQIGVNIPTLCFLKDINEIGACRMCVVDVGARSLQASCVYPVSEGLKVITNSPKVRDSRRTTLELILSNHENKCFTCNRSDNCELQKLANDHNIKEIRYEGAMFSLPVDDSSLSIVRDPKKCVLCRRCVSMCKNVQTVSAIETNGRGFETIVTSPFNISLCNTPCVNCGQCITVCPVGALREKDESEKVWDALARPDLHVVVQTAPAVRVAIGEEFGLPIGTRCTGKMVAALKAMGFANVYDTDTAADLTIMEEGTELVNRIKNGGKLPLITSCSPGWIKFCEHNYPEFLENLSTCKSPQNMFGALLKSYYAKKIGVAPEKVFVVSVMPCTAKKFEAQRPELSVDGLPDIDVVITTRELADMIREAGLDFVNLEDAQYDDPMGIGTGAGVIFGATGGVMEAALRSAAFLLTGQDDDSMEIGVVRGVDDIKEAEVTVAGVTLKAAIVHGLGNARILMDKIKAGEADYHFIEIMACPGGCVNGGGQPIVPASVRNVMDIRVERAKAIYDEDAALHIRKAHRNPVVETLYKEFFGTPASAVSHKYLHTHYTARESYPIVEE